MRRCLAPVGQGALPGCGFDAVCPAGKGAAEWRAVFWRIAEKTGFRCVLPIRKLSRRAGGRSCGIRLIAPLFAANIRGGAAVETNFSSFTTFSRPQNPNFPPFPPQPHPPTIPPLQTPQADGPCAWAVRRVCVLPPEQKRNEAPKPPAHGAGVRESEPTTLSAGTAGWLSAPPTRNLTCAPLYKRRLPAIIMVETP